ncbi:MAG TPA: GAF domain-containing protein [Magnetospirillum sp.]|nr:GAF domain-containing protein [Magnetospirillum sp.]
MSSNLWRSLESGLANAATIGQVAAEITAYGRTLIGADGVTFVIADDGYCHYLDADGISPLWKGMRFPAATCISGWVMSHRQAVTIPDVFQDHRVPHDVYRATFVKSLHMVPVGETGAAIGAYWAEYHDPTDEESTVLHRLARMANLALARVAAA